MADHVRSWLDQNRQNLPISTDQLQAALGIQQVQELAGSLGLPVDKLLAVLAVVLAVIAACAVPGLVRQPMPPNEWRAYVWLRLVPPVLAALTALFLRARLHDGFIHVLPVTEDVIDLGGVSEAFSRGVGR